MRLETGLDFTNLLGEEADGEFNIIFDSQQTINWPISIHRFQKSV